MTNALKPKRWEIELQHKLNRAKRIEEAAKDLLAHHRIKNLPDTDTLTPRIERLRSAIK